jgi:hypothetical protein
MSEFVFEIVRQGEASIVAHVLRLSGARAVWCQVEALALRVQNRDCAFIRVKNREGETVIRAGVMTALASIEKCSRVSCLLKRELMRQRLPTVRPAAADLRLRARGDRRAGSRT